MTLPDIAGRSLALMLQARRRIAVADGVSINHFTGRPIFNNGDGAVIAVGRHRGWPSSRLAVIAVE
ncbi:MAG: hypothetical protein WA652_06810 [Xanthobacteraceae bacterium]